VASDERYNFIIGMEFSPGDSVTRALRAGQDVREVLRSILNEPISLGRIDSAETLRQIEQFGASLRRELEHQMQAGIQASPLFRGMPEAARVQLTPGHADALQNVGRGTPGLAEQQQLLIAALKKRARELDSLATEESKAQAEVARELAKDVEAARGVEQAERALERAYKQMAAQELKLVQLAMKEEAERQRNLDQINKGHYARMQAEDKSARSAADKEAKAAATRSELAAQGLLPQGLGIKLPSVDAENALAQAGSGYRDVRAEAARLATSAKELASAQVDAAIGLQGDQVRQRGAMQAFSEAMRRRAEIEDEIALRERAMRGADTVDRRRYGSEIAALEAEKQWIDVAGARGRAKASTEAVMAAETRLSQVITQRAATSESLAQVEGQVKAAEQKVAAAQASYESARGSDKLFAPPVEELTNAQARTTAARARLALAEERVAAGELTGEKATAAVATARSSLRTAIEQEASAERNLANATQRVASTRQETGAGGFRDQFALGFKGASDRPYAEQIGQAFKFSVFYGTAYKALFALTQTLQQTLQEGIEFQQAMTELKLAAGESRDGLEELAGRLGDSAVAAGAAPSQGVLVGARSLGLYGATAAQGASIDEQNRVAEISARVVSQMSLGSGRSPADLQNDIAAITQAFQTGAGGQLRVQDLDAYFSRQFGIAPGSTVQAVSEAGTVGRAAGFSQEEVTAIAADMIARTGQTPAAIAGYMAQIFSRGGEGSLTTVAQRYGIDTTADLATQIKELANVYKSASNEERAQISAAFGRGKVQNAAIALLQDYDTVQGMAGKSVTDATGAGADAFKLRLDNIGGQIALLVGDMKQFASQLAQSGLLDLLGGAIVAFRELIEGANEFLKIWNQLGGTTKDVVIALALLAAAARSTAVTTVIANRAGIFTGGVLPGLGVVSRETNAVAPLASRAGAATAASNLAPTAAAAGTIAALVAVGFAFTELSQKSHELAAAQDAAIGSLRDAAALGTDSTPEQFRSASSEVAAAAKQQRDAASGFWGGLVNSGSRLLGGQSDAQKAQASAASLDIEAKRLEATAKLVEARQAAGAQVPSITGPDADSLNASFDAISQGGGNATDQLKALRDVLYSTADAAKAAASQFDAQVYGATNAPAIMQTILDSVFLGQSRPGLGSIAAHAIPVVSAYLPSMDRKYDYDVSDERIAKSLSASDIQDRLTQAMAGVRSQADLTPAKASAIAAQVVGNAADSLELDDATETEKARQLMIGAVSKYILDGAQSVKDLLDKDRRLTKDEITAASTKDLATAEQILSESPEADLTGRVAQARAALRAQLAYRRKALAPPPVPTGEHAENIMFHQQQTGVGVGDDRWSSQAQDNLDKARRDFAQSLFNQFEGLRKAAQHNARSKAEVARIGQGFLRKEIAAAVRLGQTDLLAQILGQAGDGAVAIARAAIMDALKTALAAEKVKQQAMAAAAALLPVAGQIAQMAMAAQALAGQKDLLSMLDSLNTVLPSTGTGNVYGSGSDANLPDSTAGSGETAMERAAAAAAARAARSESPIAQARAQILSARAAMAKAKKGTVEYYNALGQFYEARNQLTDAILDYRHNLGLLNIDITDPVAQANLAVREAQAKLRSDRGKGKDVRAADKVALQQAQSDQESTAFQTRLETVQTAEQLGRMSHAAYINYLQNESKRLNNIKDRTYQQQQELNQIDQLLKEAADQMQGQWNFGDIKLPTPYQVRRYIASRSGDDRSVTGGPHGDGGRPIVNDTRVYIDGADVGMVRRIITEVVGHNGRTTTTAGRRR